jgi:hypothetical protein
MRRRMSKELAKYGIKTVTNLATAEELPVAPQPAIIAGAPDLLVRSRTRCDTRWSRSCNPAQRKGIAPKLNQQRAVKRLFTVYRADRPSHDVFRR